MPDGMKFFCGAALVCSVSLFAADFWNAKPFTDWNEKDAQKMLENSPWSRPLSIATGMEGPAAGNNGGKRGGRGAMGETASDSAQSGRMGDNPMGDPGSGVGGRNRTGEEVGPIATTTVTVRWQSALPVRQAMVKLKYGNEAGTSPEAKKFLEAPQNAYVIALSGSLQPMFRGGDNDAIKKMLMEETTIAVKGKDALKPADIQSGRAGKGLEIYFIFPKSAEFSLEDKEVEFSTKLGKISVKQKFKLK